MRPLPYTQSFQEPDEDFGEMDTMDRVWEDLIMKNSSNKIEKTLRASYTNGVDAERDAHYWRRRETTIMAMHEEIRLDLTRMFNRGSAKKAEDMLRRLLSKVAEYREDRWNQ